MIKGMPTMTEYLDGKRAEPADLISRADAIEAVHEYYQKRFTEGSKWDADAKMFVLEDKTIAKDNMEICNIINALPSAELPKGDLISRADAIERIVNDNVVGGMDRINEYRNSNEHNDYLDGISTAIATVDDVPSADAEFADMPDIPRYYYEKVVGNMAHEINMLKEQLESAEAVQGEWVKDYEKNIYKCSVCGCEEVVPTCMGEPTVWKYCPNCGSAISTRMKGGAE